MSNDHPFVWSLKWYKLCPMNRMKNKFLCLSILYCPSLLLASDCFYWRCLVKPLRRTCEVYCQQCWDMLTGSRKGDRGLWSRSLSAGSWSHFLFCFISSLFRWSTTQMAKEQLPIPKSVGIRWMSVFVAVSGYIWHSLIKVTFLVLLLYKVRPHIESLKFTDCQYQI